MRFLLSRFLILLPFVDRVAAIQKCDANCARCRVFAHEVSGCDPERKIPCQTGWHCMQCRAGYELWFDRCFVPCPTGQFRYGYECQKCTKNCLRCTGPHPHECIQCAPTHEFDARNLCVKRCADGYYPALEDYQTQELAIYPNFGEGRSEAQIDFGGCGLCHHTCKTCRSWSAITCTSCDAESYLRQNFWAANAGTTRGSPGTGECVPISARGFYYKKPEDSRQYECPPGTLRCESAWRAFECDLTSHNYEPVVQKCFTKPLLDQAEITAESYLGDAVNNPGAPSWSSVSTVALEGLGVQTAAAQQSAAASLLRHMMEVREAKKGPQTAPTSPAATSSVTNHDKQAGSSDTTIPAPPRSLDVPPPSGERADQTEKKQSVSHGESRIDQPAAKRVDSEKKADSTGLETWEDLHTYVAPNSMLEKRLLTGEEGKQISDLLGGEEGRSTENLARAGRRRGRTARAEHEKAQDAMSTGEGKERAEREKANYEDNIERAALDGPHRATQRTPNRRKEMNRYKGKRTRQEVMEADKGYWGARGPREQ
ncbi:unnamed protein product [Amoebophrya sp. A25]|nr:unnamed protein product [Amoebophrya sp. A25]|eukprot:GSA25T00024821001.1